jgi:DNA-binding PadR family transcriptional regulator
MSVEDYMDVMVTDIRESIFSLVVLYVVNTAKEPIHGYVITKDLDEGTEGRLHIEAGTLHPILKDLVNHGLIEFEMVKSTEGPPEKVYRTTKDGRQALEEGMHMVVDLFQGVGTTVGKDWPELEVRS